MGSTFQNARPRDSHAFVFTPTTGSGDAEAVLSEHDHGKVHVVGSRDLLHDSRHAIGKRGWRVGVQNHCRFSGSMFSNSASMMRSIRRFSLWRCKGYGRPAGSHAKAAGRGGAFGE